jgi:hypothetical protein
VKPDCLAYKAALSKRPPSGDANKVHAVSNINVMSGVCVTLQSENIPTNKNGNTHQNPYVQTALIRDVSVNMLRDTGADISIIKSTLVGDGEYTGSHVYVRPILSHDIMKLPLAKVTIRSPTVNGLLCFTVTDADLVDYDVIVGNDHDTDTAVSAGAVTHLKTGIFIKRPVRYLDTNVTRGAIDDHDDNVVSDDHTDIVVADIDGDNNDGDNVDSADVKGRFVAH